MKRAMATVMRVAGKAMVLQGWRAIDCNGNQEGSGNGNEGGGRQRGQSQQRGQWQQQ
jgi:hypothetical protein